MFHKSCNISNCSFMTRMTPSPTVRCTCPREQSRAFLCLDRLLCLAWITASLTSGALAQVRGNDLEFVSASSDGSCIIWDMRRFARNNSLFASTFFKAVLYHPDESQLLTTGTDRKITNWDAYDGSAIRIVDGSTAAEVSLVWSGHAFLAPVCDNAWRHAVFDQRSWKGECVCVPLRGACVRRCTEECGLY